MTSKYLKESLVKLATLRTDAERIGSDENRDAIKKDMCGGFTYDAYPAMFGQLTGRVQNAEYDILAAQRYADTLEATERDYERLISILEALDIETDEETLSALELMSKREWATGNRVFETSKYKSERRAVALAVSNAVNTVLEGEVEYEQENATDELTKAGFVLNDDDQWTRDQERIVIERAATLKHQPRRTCYTWSWCDMASGTFESGRSGDFHRLLALIAPKPVEVA